MEARAPSDTELLLELVGDAYSYEDLEEFRSGVLQALRRLVPYDAAAYNEITFGEAFVVGVPEMDPALLGVFAELSHENPLIERFERTKDGRPYRMSDVVDQPTFHGLALYQRFYRLVGVERQVAFTLPSTNSPLVGIALTRERDDFTDREVRLLAMSRPHLIQAYRNAEMWGARTAMLAALEEGLGSVDCHLVVLDPAGRVEYAGDATRRLLGEGALEKLPGLVALWLAEADACRSSSEPLQLDGADGRVLIRALPSDRADRRRVLLVDADDGRLTVDLLRGLGLTGRQAETLRWVALGNTPAQTARRMRVAPRTVDKHLQHVYAALGASDLAQAVSTAWAAVGIER